MSSAEGSESGKTVLTVTEDLGEGNHYRAKAYVSANPTMPTFGLDLSTWAQYTEGEDFATTDGYSVIVCECTSYNLALKGGKATADVAV